MSDEILITPRPTPPPAPPTPQPPPTLPRGMRLETTVWNYCDNRPGGFRANLKKGDQNETCI